MNFFKNIAKSVYSPAFYLELRTRSTWLSLRYYLGLSAIIALILGLAATAVFGPILLQFVSKAEPVVRDLYPSELVVTVKSGSAATNVAEPYTIKVPKEMQEFFGATSTISLVTIDTRQNADITNFLALRTLFLVAKDGIVLNKDLDGGAAGAEFHAYTKDFVMTKDVYVGFVDKLTGFGDKLPYAMMVFLVVALFLWGVARLVYCLPVAVLVYLILKTRNTTGEPVSYGHAYRTTVHAATLPILINFFFAFASGNIMMLAGVPFLFTLILLAVVWMNTRAAQS